MSSGSRASPEYVYLEHHRKKDTGEDGDTHTKLLKLSFKLGLYVVLGFPVVIPVFKPFPGFSLVCEGEETFAAHVRIVVFIFDILHGGTMVIPGPFFHTRANRFTHLHVAHIVEVHVVAAEVGTVTLLHLSIW